MDQTIQLFKSLPKDMQEAVRMYIQFLVEKVKTEKKPGTPEDDYQPTIRWAEAPDPTSIFGLAKNKPISIHTIRAKAWRR